MLGWHACRDWHFTSPPLLCAEAAVTDVNSRERQVKVCSCWSLEYSQALFIVTWTSIPSFLLQKFIKASFTMHTIQSPGESSTTSEWLVHSQHAHHSAPKETGSYLGKHGTYAKIMMKYSQSLQASLLDGLAVMIDLLTGSSSLLYSETLRNHCFKKI